MQTVAVGLAMNERYIGLNGDAVHVVPRSCPSRWPFRLLDDAEERVWSAAYISALERPHREYGRGWIAASEIADRTVYLFRTRRPHRTEEMAGLRDRVAVE